MFAPFQGLEYDLGAAGDDIKQRSFSLPQLIKTNPALTPCCWISANLSLMTDRGGGVDCVCVWKE